MLVWTSFEKQGISKTSGARKQSGMNCKQFFEKRKNSLKNCWQSSGDMLLYNTSSTRGNQLRQRLLIKRLICPALGLELITYLGTEWFDKVLKKLKKFLTNKTDYANINKLSLLRTTRTHRKRQGSLITEQ